MDVSPFATSAAVSATPATMVDQWTALVALLMPFLCSVIMQSHWSATAKRLLACAACLAATVVQLSLEGRLDSAHLLPTFLTVFSLSQVLFHHFFKPLGLTTAVEKATNISNDYEPKTQ